MKNLLQKSTTSLTLQAELLGHCDLCINDDITRVTEKWNKKIKGLKEKHQEDRFNHKIANSLQQQNSENFNEIQTILETPLRNQENDDQTDIILSKANSEELGTIEIVQLPIENFEKPLIEKQKNLDGILQTAKKKRSTQK